MQNILLHYVLFFLLSKRLKNSLWPLTNFWYASKRTVYVLKMTSFHLLRDLIRDELTEAVA